MSTPKNPLHEYHSIHHKHVLVAFQYMEDASSFNITPEAGKEGEPVAGCGKGVVVVNEFQGGRYYINNATWEYNYYGLDRSMVSSSNGVIEITEKVGLSFMDFLLTVAIPSLGDVTVSHAGFALRTFFICQKAEASTPEIIVGNPYVFNVTNIVSGVNNESGSTNTHNLLALGSAQSVGQLPAYSELSQMTITHKDQNPNAEIPVPIAASGGLEYRGTEDSKKYPGRDSRLGKNKPMKTLKDAFEAFELELDTQKFSHKGQLQKWLGNVRDEYTDKIKVPPEQKKKPDGEPLPIIFKVKLDPKYAGYQINNRNIPFEQPEQSQLQDGIRTIPVGAGEDILDAIKTICRLSKKIGEDALKSVPTIPKVTVTAVRKCDSKMHITVIIKKTEHPTNSLVLGTGAGEGAVAPLTFFINSDTTDRDVLSIYSKISYSIGSDTLEEHIDSPEANVVYGDREQVTSERSRDIDFFKTMNSGTRVNESLGLVNGKEHGDLAAAVGTLSPKQMSVFNLRIRGNPNLMSDVNRRPQEVADLTAGETHHYAFPEYYAMYLKLRLFEASYSTIGFREPEESGVSDAHYFDKYYHISKVRNIFTVLDDSNNSVRGFNQELELRRTDDFM